MTDNFSTRPHAKLHGSTSVSPGVTEATSQDWQIIGGLISRVCFFTFATEAVVGKATGLYRTNGAGAQLRIVRDDSLFAAAQGVAALSASFDLADTAGVWAPFDFSTNTPSPCGLAEFRLEMRLNGVTDGAVRSASLAMLEP